MLELIDPKQLKLNVDAALLEDDAFNDITAQLLPERLKATAHLYARDAAILCGCPWAEHTFQTLDPNIAITWNQFDGDLLKINEVIATISGNARSILSAERTAINFLQTLSSTATICDSFKKVISGTNTILLDTRKTIPGLRYAQKYAVVCGGCKNHRLNLSDCFLIKENHIRSIGSISQAIAKAQGLYPNKTLEIEVENLDELEEAILAGCQLIMLDNFSISDIEKAITQCNGRAKLEVSGNIKDTVYLRKIASLGIDFISVGALTKNIQATDFSLQIDIQ